MERQQLISKIIKISIGIIFAVFFVILLSQYITMAQLSAKQQNLTNELQTQTTEYEKLNEEYESIAENYEDYVTDYTRDNYDYSSEGDILINK